MTCKLLAVVIIALLSSVADAGNFVRYRVGTLRTECQELCEWDYSRPFAELLLAQTRRLDDGDTVDLWANSYSALHKSLIQWRAEKAKSPEQRNREALVETIEWFWFLHGDKLRLR